MRVLFWSSTFWPQIGGVEVLAAKLLPALQARGYEYAVAAPKPHPDLPDEETYKGIPVHRFLFWNNLHHDSIDHVAETRQKVIRLKRSFAPSLIHLNHVGFSDFFHLITAKAHASPSLVTLHGEWPDKANTTVGHTLRTADWIVGCSAAILKKGRSLAPEILTRSSVIYNSIESPTLDPAALPFNPPRLLCLGRLSVEKGFDLAMSAFASIVGRFPQARLIVAGDGPERARLQRQILDSRLTDSVDFIGWVKPDNVPALINTATMVIMPSRLDSFPLVALQAGILARPVVATRVGGLPEIVLHHETGMLVEKENSQGLADAICFLLENSAAAVQMGQAARTRVQTLFDWERHVDAYDALYRQLV